jgi:hypothetical protein
MKYSDLILIFTWLMSQLLLIGSTYFPVMRNLPRALRYPRFFQFLSFTTLVYVVAVFSPITHFEVVVFTFAFLLQSLLTLEWETPDSRSTIPGIKIVSWILQIGIIFFLAYYSDFNPISYLVAGVLIVAMRSSKFHLQSYLSATIWVIFIIKRLVE